MVDQLVSGLDADVEFILEFIFLNPIKLSNVYFCFMAVILMFSLIVCMCKLFVI